MRTGDSLLTLLCINCLYFLIHSILYTRGWVANHPKFIEIHLHIPTRRQSLGVLVDQNRHLVRLVGPGSKVFGLHLRPSPISTLSNEESGTIMGLKFGDKLDSVVKSQGEIKEKMAQLSATCLAVQAQLVKDNGLAERKLEAEIERRLKERIDGEKVADAEGSRFQKWLREFQGRVKELQEQVKGWENDPKPHRWPGAFLRFDGPGFLLR